MRNKKRKKKTHLGEWILNLCATNYKCAFLLQSHFSLKKGAAALGIGTDSVILIKCDERWVHLQPSLVSSLQLPHVYLSVQMQALTVGWGAKPPPCRLAVRRFFLTWALAWSPGTLFLNAIEPSMALDWVGTFVKSIKIFFTKKVWKDIHHLRT